MNRSGSTLPECLALLALGMLAGLMLAASHGHAQDQLTRILRAHQEAPHAGPCTEYDTGHGCDCKLKAYAILADLADHGIAGRYVELADTRAMPYPDGKLPGHAVVYVGKYQLDPESPTLERADSWAPLWREVPAEVSSR